ncbi:glycine cleavage system protein GcvH [Salinisphaera hydrothermalis]|uniref:Glycine cleavage system H protein n=1 Tax=Salinisphaera hydrothermalis (strain C41B8) TaxID=1304275 RepID=A0A084ILH5_SALHC|nr:glycine cleavage system protein GcvH [Salinisphaera hydrothermalis]KEZ77559.1 glycine cleavage system H protein [Salinisphaera hydrothermalis C41B8]
MSDIPNELSYTKSHEWVANDGDGTVTVGITEYAQGSLGDLVFVELPETGTKFAVGDPVAVVESVKAASDIYAPVDGEIVEVNEELADSPERVNEDPFGEGWLFKMTVDNTEQLSDLLDAEAYGDIVEAEED